MKTSILLTCLLSLQQVGAWTPMPSALTTMRTSTKTVEVSKKALHMKNNFQEDEMKTGTKIQQFDFPDSNDNTNINVNFLSLTAATAAAAMATVPLPAEAAAAASDAIPSAFAAYGHYLSLFMIVGLITYERITVEPGISIQKEKNLALADIGVGIMGVAILVSGYFRATQYGKGWYFYSHEPIFWLKMLFLCIFGAASLFPTATFIKRSVAIQQGKDLEPMSEKLAARLQQVLNAELVMLGSIPLAATLMSRGVGYTESIPFNIIGPVLCAITAGGLGFKYVKEAVTWTEDEVPAAKIEEKELTEV